MSPRIYRFGDCSLNTLARELRRAGVPVALSPRAFDCLVFLIANRDRAIGKDELIIAVWGRPNVSDTQLGQAILLARRAVGDDGQVQQFIRTVSRFGYRWSGDTEVVDPDASSRDVATAKPMAGSIPPASVIAEHELSAITTQPQDATATPVRPRRALLPVVLVVAAVLSGALAWRHYAQRPRASIAADASADARASANAIVLPLRVNGDSDSAWLRLGGMDLVAERLRGGGLVVPPSEGTVALLHSAQQDDEAAAALALRATAPAALLVSGTFTQRAGAWTVDLRATTTDGARVDASAAQADALDAARDATDSLLARLGRAHPPAAPTTGRVQERLQRAQAAMLANDLDEARAILVSDPQLVREESQLGYRLAQVDFRAGEYARAEASLSALFAEASADDPAFRARLLNGRGAARIRMDDYAGAESDFDTAVALLRAHGPARDLGLALTGRGVTRSMRRAIGAALADFGEARVQLEAAGDALAVARVDSNLGGLEMNRDRPEQALAYLESAATQFERYGAINELMETLESLVSDNLALVRPAAALVASDRSWALAARVTDANQRLNLQLDRVDVFLALGRLHEAGALLAALPIATSGANAFLARRLPALRARLAFAEGRTRAAAAAARDALALRAPGDDDGEGVAEIALLLQRATLASPPRPTQAPAQAWVPLDAATVYPVQAVLKAEWADANDDQAGAASAFRDALDLAERRGVPADVALVTAAYGPWLLRHDREQAAGEVIGRVSPWADRDFDCALLQLRLFKALHQTDAWSKALAQANALAGERTIPADLREAPRPR